VERWSAQPADHEGAFTHTVLDKHGLRAHAFALYVGGPDWHKNVEGMLGGLAAARRHGVSLELAWAGHLGEEARARIAKLASHAGVSDALKLLGFVPDEELSVLYRHAIAHLLVSRCEGFGLTIVEAMASGCPVVTTRKGSLPEVAGDAALTADPDDHEAIGRALVRLARQEHLRRELSERGQARAPRFSRRTQALAMAKVYREFLGVSAADAAGGDRS
jgi:glycosyltransferase involved in cell wall biosynthesis